MAAAPRTTYAAPAARPQLYKRTNATRRKLDPVECAILAVVATYQAEQRDDIAIGYLESLLAPNVATGRISDLHTFGALSTPRDNAGDPIGTKCRLTRQGLDELYARAPDALADAKRIQSKGAPADNPQNMFKVIEILEAFLARRKQPDEAEELLDDPDPAGGAGLDTDDTGDEDLEEQLEDLELPDDEERPEAKPATAAEKPKGGKGGKRTANRRGAARRGKA